MFISRDNPVNCGGGSVMGLPMMRRVVTACFILVACGFNGLYAQCGFEENGYVFLHPYFNNVNWLATIYQSVLFPAETMCAEKPAGITMSRAAIPGTAVYATAAGKLMLTEGPLVDNNCVCCRPTIEFGDPVEIAVLAALDLQASLPFHLLTVESNGDSAYLVAASSGDRVYCLHIHTTSGAIGGIDTLPVDLAEQQVIGGVWGEPDGAGRDTALWIGGSGGLLRLIPVNNGQWESEREMIIDDSETVSAVGGGYAGTASGRIYRRSGASFTLDNSSASSPLRSINRRIAVGDDGTVLINRGGTWRSYASGNTDYRFGNLTANAGGTAVELLDEAWNYSARTLFDSVTTISSITPSEVAECLNDDPYQFTYNRDLRVAIGLMDSDDNREIPSVTLISGSVATALNKAGDGSKLLRHDPAAVCSTTKAFFNDTLVHLVISPVEVTLEANAQRGVYDVSCKFWRWQPFLFTAGGAWNSTDTLVVAVNGDTLKMINSSQSTVTVNAPVHGHRAAANEPVIQCENRRIRVRTGSSSGVRRIMLVDAAGRCVWECAVVPSIRNALASPELSSGIHFLVIAYTDGRLENRRIALTGR
ncbi:MAG: hypothetical protein JXA18_10450 [Chitinispirillaceae bacterium]|nr:hypothetical protein [Chitinispirillaceae bacterium]